MHHLWTSALSSLRGRLSDENFRTWLEPIHFEKLEDKTVTLCIPNRFYADWISSHYLYLIVEALSKEAGVTDLVVEWVIDETLQEKLNARAEEARRTEEVARARPSAPPPAPATSLSKTPCESGLNPKYRFDNFIVGPSNQLAHAASMAAASSPGSRYNPLFIYGGVGLGKTHLVNAIGHRVRQDKPHARVLFLSAERFTNEFIWALQNHRINQFRERYRSNCDVLCIDDIQFLAGREQTQEEFFHTFNALYHADRQIVVTSDVYPQQIKEMEERLVSRFEWGLVADIQAPAIDTRIAILKKKAEQERIELTDEVAFLIAQHAHSNVRELEGTLLRLAVKAELVEKRGGIDIEFAKRALGTIAPLIPERQTTVEDIQRATCTYFNIRLSDMKSHRRHRAVSFPRMVAMYVCRQHLNMSYPSLGDRFGGKDHTTVLSACRKIGGLYAKDDRDVLTAVAAIERKVGLAPR